MRTTLTALGLAAGIGLIFCQSAGATPASPAALKQAATAASTVQQVQYAERRGKRHVVKCYRELVIGPYRCHRYHW